MAQSNEGTKLGHKTHAEQVKLAEKKFGVDLSPKAIKARRRARLGSFYGDVAARIQELADRQIRFGHGATGGAKYSFIRELGDSRNDVKQRDKIVKLLIRGSGQDPESNDKKITIPAVKTTPSTPVTKPKPKPNKPKYPIGPGLPHISDLINPNYGFETFRIAPINLPQPHTSNDDSAPQPILPTGVEYAPV